MFLFTIIMKSLFKKTQDIFSNKSKINKSHQNKVELNKNNFFSCPKCDERILIALNPINFSLSYNCENNHEERNLDYNIFYQNRYINGNKNKLCQQCKKEKLNINKTIYCTICNMKLCGTCMLNHKNIYKHNNFGLMYNSIKKCNKHYMDISLYCKTCNKNLCSFCAKKNKEENEHFNHDIVNFSDLIPRENEIKNNESKLQQKIIKNNAIINKLKNWKEEMCSLIDETIDKLNKDKLINKMLIQNFNWKYLDYINYKNYEMAIKKLEIMNEGLEQFYNSKMFIEQTNAINNYLFGESYKKIEQENNIINENNNIIEKEIKIEEKKINNEIKNEIQFNIIKRINKNEENENVEKKIIDTLKNEKALFYNKNIIYSLENKNLSKIYENNKIENKNKKREDDNIYKNLQDLKNNLNTKLGNYNILIWKTENDIKKDKLINLIKEEKKVKKFENIQIIDNENFIIEKIKKLENENKSIFTRNNQNINNNNENENSNRSKDNLLFSETNSLFNSNLLSNINNNNNEINNNRFFNGGFNSNSNINNELTRISTNDNFNNNYLNNNNNRIQEREEEYVYISRTGSKYHGRPQCGRMKVSTRVTLSKAEAMGLGPCMKCY